jgi:hypothetical protein
MGLLAAAPLLAACGYGFATRPEYIPAGARTISLRSFENQSEQIGVEHALAAALEDVIRERGVLRIVYGAEGDLVLSGTIRRFSYTRPVASSGVDRAVIYASVMVLDVVLARGGEGEVLWKGDNLIEVVDVPVAAGVVIPSSPTFQQGTLNAGNVTNLGDIQLAEDRLGREVLQGLVGTMARSIYSQMMEGF